MTEPDNPIDVNNDMNVNATLPSPHFNASTKALFLAYISMLTMALLPIIIGSIRSIRFHSDEREEFKKDPAKSKGEIFTQRKAMLFPFWASIVLFSLYMIFKYLPPDLVNLFMSFFFTVLGVLSLADFIEKSIVNCGYLQAVLFSLYGKPINQLTIITVVLSGMLGTWYFIEKHWFANNLFGLSLATSAIESIPLQSISIATTMLCGLFIYDIFWVFGTDVMVTVAKSFDAPIKLIFPVDFLELGFAGKSHTMLGLGDIVVPGLLIALFCRYDDFTKRGSKFYFSVSLFAYVLGLIITVFILQMFKAAQPALLYLVPTCLGIPLFAAMLRGDISSLLNYEDYTDLTSSVDMTVENVVTRIKEE